MSIINGPEKLDIKEILKSAESYCSVNRMNKDEVSEINFLCKAFCKFYNSTVKREEIYTPKTIYELFDEMVKSTLLVDDWSGLTTHANLFLKDIPAIKKILDEDSLNKIVEKKKTTVRTTKPISRSFDYGGCGGGYSYGPSC